MSTESVRTAGPAAERFAGPGPSRTAKRLFHATRPKFYPASLLPVLAGSAWGIAMSGSFDGIVFALALVATLCVHAGANALNDVGDDRGGTDRLNEDRIYPYTGGSRFIQTGILGEDQMRRLGIGLLTAAAAAGAALLMLKGPIVLAFGLAGVALAILYSLGPIKLSGLGVGEAAVGVAFGVLPVTGAAWLQSGTIDAAVVLYSLPISAWVAAILLINEVPDIAADGATGKRTLPVRLGLAGTARLYLALHTGAMLVVVALGANGALPILAPLVAIVLLYPAYRASLAVRTGVADRGAMRRAIEATLAIHTIGSLCLIASVLFAAWSTSH